MGEDEKKKPQTKAAVIAFEIGFKEIESLYDLTARRRVIGSPDKPQRVYETPPMFYYSYGSRLDPRFEDELGTKINGVKGDMPGVYQGIRIYGHGAALRTFSRKRAQKIDDKWVYVFVSDTKDGSKMQLLSEIYFKDGEAQLVDLNANKEKNDRKPSGEKRKKLVLELKSISMKDGPFFWFLLAPYQLPWASLAKMVKSGSKLASRCQRLFDEFYTDGSIGGGEPKTLWEAFVEGKDKPISFLMYLLDPFKEALMRAEAYAEVVQMWQDIQTQLGSDNEYVLAKRIYNLPKSHVDLVWHKLGPYLDEKEKLVRMLLRVSTMRLEDLVCWIGETHKREKYGKGVKAAGAKASVMSTDTWLYLEGGKLAGALEEKGDYAEHNPFSDLVGDYNDENTPAETAVKVGEVVSAVHSRLEDLPRGQDFLKKIVNEAYRGKLPLADGGAKLLFEAARKGDSASAEVVGALLKYYAPKWVDAYRSDALPQLVKFMREKHKIELKQIKPSRVRKIEQKLAAKAHNQAAKKGLDKLAAHYHLSVEPASVRGLNMSDKAFNRLAFGIEVFNMKYSISEFANEKDFWAGLGLLGSTIDAYSAISKLYPKLAETKFAYSFGGARKVIKVAPILAVISSAIDTVLAGRDVYNSTNFGQAAGHSIRTIGAAMTVGGALAAKTGVGVVVAIVGLGLQAIGSGIASQFDDLKQFLRHCKWGEASTLDGMSNWFSDSNNFGYKGDLDDLRKDINAQLRALDWMFWVFKPEFDESNGGDGHKAGLWMKMNPPKALTPAAVWTVKLDVIDRNDPSKSKKYEWTAVDEIDHATLSSNEEVYLITPDHDVSVGQGSRHQRGRVQLKGEMKLDVFGDGSSYIVRQIDKNIDLSW